MHRGIRAGHAFATNVQLSRKSLLAEVDQRLGSALPHRSKVALTGHRVGYGLGEWPDRGFEGSGLGGCQGHPIVGQVPGLDLGAREVSAPGELALQVVQLTIEAVIRQQPRTQPPHVRRTPLARKLDEDLGHRRDGFWAESLLEDAHLGQNGEPVDWCQRWDRRWDRRVRARLTDVSCTGLRAGLGSPDR